MQPEQKQQTREQFVKSLFVLEQEDNYLLSKEGIDKLIKGIEKGVAVIAETYGTGGANALIDHDYAPLYEISNDGKKILDSMQLADKYENKGLQILKEITAKIEKESGNGRKTAVLLAGAILRKGLESKLKPMELKKSLNDCLPIILKSLDSQSKQITAQDIAKVATIASENEELGKTFQEIYSQIGKDGVVEIDNSGLPETFYEITEGVRLRNCGFMYPYMANSDKGRSAVYSNPKVAIIKEKITSITQLSPIFKSLESSGSNEIIIFCDEIDYTVMGHLAFKHNGMTVNGIPTFPIKNLVIKAPILWKDWLFEDFAKITGAKIINPAEGTSLKSFSNSWLGTCDRITTTKDETVVTGIKDISDHLKVLKEQNTNESLLRASWLQTKTAILKLGANSESELSHLRGKASDARNSSYLALQDGVVAGGGIAYLNAISSLPKTAGGDILKEALQAPFLQIVENSEKECDINLVGGKDGFDSRKGTIVDMEKEGILDATVVVKNSLISALSVTSTILTIKPIIIKK